MYGPLERVCEVYPSTQRLVALRVRAFVQVGRDMGRLDVPHQNRLARELVCVCTALPAAYEHFRVVPSIGNQVRD